ncbi:hypothetical protein D9M72_482050 [compost metagenome]
MLGIADRAAHVDHALHRHVGRRAHHAQRQVGIGDRAGNVAAGGHDPDARHAARDRRRGAIVLGHRQPWRIQRGGAGRLLLDQHAAPLDQRADAARAAGGALERRRQHGKAVAAGLAVGDQRGLHAQDVGLGKGRRQLGDGARLMHAARRCGWRAGEARIGGRRRQRLVVGVRLRPDQDVGRGHQRDFVDLSQRLQAARLA